MRMRTSGRASSMALAVVKYSAFMRDPSPVRRPAALLPLPVRNSRNTCISLRLPCRPEEFDRAFRRLGHGHGPLFQRHRFLRLHARQRILPGTARRRPVFQFSAVFATRTFADDLDAFIRQELPREEGVLFPDIREARD